MPHRRIAAVGVVLVVVAFAMWNANRRSQDSSGDPNDGAVKSRRTLMGTEFGVTIWSPKEKSALARETLNEVFGELERLESRISSWMPDSETTKINQSAGGTPITLSDEMGKLIDRSIFWSRQTGGAFDATGGPLFELWERAREEGQLPDEREVERRIALTGIENLHFTDGHLQMEKSGMKLGFGAIGKGFAADHAAAFLTAKGFPNHLIDAGGDLLAKGKRGDRPWRVAVRNPRRRDDFLGVLEATDCAIATSGDYERYFSIEGKRYSHILDLRTGWPATHLSSVTVIARNATDADALATALFVMKAEEGFALVESLPEVEAIVVDENETLTLSSGLRLADERLTLDWK